MDVLCLKGTYPPGILRRIKGLLSQELKAQRWQHDLVNPFEDRSHLLPLLIRHPRQACIPLDKGVSSPEAEIIQVPSGLTAQAFTQRICPYKERSLAPVRASQILSVLSSHAAA